jgi:aryl-alcohol dehydrogenase-like predicted oxidoreductase
MKMVRVPHSDLEISRAVFGTGRLGGTVERFDRRESLLILQTAKEAGINCFDTADIYAQGNSERLLAEAFRHHRDQVIYATKGGYVLSGKARLLAKVKPLVRRFMRAKPGFMRTAARVRGGQMTKDFSRQHLARALESSLRRLKTDYVDLYQLHSPDASDLASEEVFATLGNFKAAGKIRAYGVSVLAWDHVPHCFGRGVSWVQVSADLLGDQGHDEIIARAADEGMLLVARQAFSSGLLFQDLAQLGASNSPGDQASIERLRTRLLAIRQLGDAAEVILRYLRHHAPFGAFLVATTQLLNLRKNLESLRLPAFSDPELKLLAGHLPVARSVNH